MSNFYVSSNTIIATTSDGATSNRDVRTSYNISFISGHKYYYSLEVANNDSINMLISTYNSSGSPLNYIILSEITSTLTKKSGVIRASNGNPSALRIGLRNDVPTGIYTLTIRNVMFIDLTAIFGSGNEPTAEQFESMFPAVYYPYNAGELLSVQASGIKTTDPVVGNSEADVSIWRNLTDPSDPTKLLFPNGLCSAGTVHDEVTATTAIKRIGSVDLGTLTYTYIYNSFSADINDMIMYTKTYSIPNYTCSKYPTGTQAQASDKTIYQAANTNGFYIKDSSYTDAATFKAAMNGVMLYYELATPIIVDLPRRLNLSYPVSLATTESVVPSNAVVSVGETKPQTAPVITTNTYSGVDVSNYLLPKEYTELEYIESTGTQYLDLDVLLSPNHVAYVKWANGRGFLFGFTAGSNGRWGVSINYQSENATFFSDYSNTEFIRSITSINTGVFNFRTGAIVNGIEYNFTDTPSRTASQSSYLFKANGSSVDPEGKIYFFKLYNNNILVMNLIPCIDQNNVVCMYDTVSKQCFYNQGTGEFVAGSIIPR